MRIERDITGKEVLKVVVDDENIRLLGRIADLSDVTFISKGGSVDLEKNIDGRATLLVIAEMNIRFKGEFNSETSSNLRSKNGSVYIESEDGGKVNINGDAILNIESQEDVFFRGDVNSQGNLKITSKRGEVHITGDLNSNAKLSIISEGNISINGDINSRTTVELISTRGSIEITGHIHSESSVKLTAAQNISIGKDIEGKLSVLARCGGELTLDDKIGDQAYIEFKAHDGIHIRGDISGRSVVKMAVGTDRIRNITIDGNIESTTNVTYWPPSALETSAAYDPDAVLIENWTHALQSTELEMEGYWWNNWLYSYGFVSDKILRPRSYSALLKLLHTFDHKVHKIKAVGGGWSSSDITIPSDNSIEVQRLSIQEKGKKNVADLRKVLRHMEDMDTPLDLYPNQVLQSLNHSTYYDTTLGRNTTRNGIDLPSTVTATNEALPGARVSNPKMSASNASPFCQLS